MGAVKILSVKETRSEFSRVGRAVRDGKAVREPGLAWLVELDGEIERCARLFVRGARFAVLEQKGGVLVLLPNATVPRVGDDAQLKVQAQTVEQRDVQAMRAEFDKERSALNDARAALNVDRMALVKEREAFRAEKRAASPVAAVREKLLERKSVRAEAATATPANVRKGDD